MRLVMKKRRTTSIQPTGGQALYWPGSIDALAVGISLAVTGYHTIRQLAMPLVVIGLGSFLFAMLGHWLGMRFGSSIRRRLQPELLGGIILIGIGVKVLITHLCDA